MNPIGFLMSKRKVIIINDKNLVDFSEVSLPNSNLAKNFFGLVNDELQGKINECIKISNDYQKTMIIMKKRMKKKKKKMKNQYKT